MKFLLGKMYEIINNVLVLRPIIRLIKYIRYIDNYTPCTHEQRTYNIDKNRLGKYVNKYYKYTRDSIENIYSNKYMFLPFD